MDILIMYSSFSRISRLNNHRFHILLNIALLLRVVNQAVLGFYVKIKVTKVKL